MKSDNSYKLGSAYCCSPTEFCDAMARIMKERNEANAKRLDEVEALYDKLRRAQTIEIRH